MKSKNIWIFFDLDDTLYDQSIPFKLACDKIFPDNDFPVSDLFVSYRKYSDEIFELTESKQIGMNDMYIYRIKKALKEYNVEITNELALKFQRKYKEYQNLITLFPDMIDVLRYCMSNFINMGIITNGPEKHQLNKIRTLGLNQYISEKNIWISSAVGVAKPNKKIFEFVEIQNNIIDRNNVFFIGDSFENDIIGAKKANWKAIWINRRGKIAPNSSVIIPDKIVYDGKELLQYIENT